MLKNTLPLGLLVLALVSPCLMAPFWSDDDLATSGRDDEDSPLISRAFNIEDYPLFNMRQPVEEPKSKLIITPNGIFFRSYFAVGPFDNNNSDEDTKSPADSDETQGLEPTAFTSNWEPFFLRPRFTFNSDTDNTITDQPDKSDEDEVVKQINENYLRNLIQTITVLAKLNEIMENINSNEDTTTNVDDDSTKVILDNENSENDIDVKTDDNGGTNVIAKSASNPNVDIKLTFDGFTDDDKIEPVDEKIENSITDDENDDDDENKAVPSLLDNEFSKNSDEYDYSEFDSTTTTKRTTEWDESDEIDQVLKNAFDEFEKSDGKEVNDINFVPVLESNLNDMNYQPKYKLITI